MIIYLYLRTLRSNCPAAPVHEPLGKMKPGDSMSNGGQISYLSGSKIIFQDKCFCIVA